MKTIQIDDAVYVHLLNNTSAIGEDASSILRRLLGLSGPREILPRRTKQVPIGLGPVSPSLSAQEAVSRIRRRGTAAHDFLHALSELATNYGERFHLVLNVRGRRRLYFAQTQEALEASGRSVDPAQIPGTEFWVVTNNDTPKKRSILSEVLAKLDVPAAEQAQWMNRL